MSTEFRTFKLGSPTSEWHSKAQNSFFIHEPSPTVPKGQKSAKNYLWAKAVKIGCLKLRVYLRQTELPQSEKYLYLRLKVKG
jgi:hypothetical protein